MNATANDQRPVRKLIEAALSADDDEAWDAVAALHWRGNREVLDEALKLCGAADPGHRARGADILGQLGVPDRTFPEECFGALERLLLDPEPQVLDSAIMAMAHIDRDRSAALILPFRRDADPNVRFAVADVLGSVESDEATWALMELMTDVDSDVRDWATFGLGQSSNADS